MRIQDQLGIINCEEFKNLPHLQADKLACQFHRYPLSEVPIGKTHQSQRIVAQGGHYDLGAPKIENVPRLDVQPPIQPIG